MARIVNVLRAGKLEYQHSLNLQMTLAKTPPIANVFKNMLILTEHSPVYTIGIRNKDYSMAERDRLRALGAQFYQTNRGGLITFHGPGQLVVYPILNLKQFNAGIRWYVCHLEKTIIDLCAKFGLKGETSPDTGVWIQDRKICAIGVHGSRYITTHGLALNCDTELRWFDHIVPCGIEGKGVTSVSQELGKRVGIQEVESSFLDSFQRTFMCELHNVCADDTSAYLKEFRS